ncbi:MAG: hypothetical protein EOP05_01960 [Proteobacteria bacterium]|nr:MAG: hypothetical protein EOP05_01960 [Pseudomonadota bacterium]
MKFKCTLMLLPFVIALSACSPSVKGLPNLTGSPSTPDEATSPDKSGAPVSFETWKGLSGRYDIIRFDERDLSNSNHIAFIELDNQRYSNAAGESLVMLKLPLYSYIREGAASVYNLGPFEKIGVTTGDRVGDVTAYSYSVDDTIYQGGSAHNLKLSIKAVVEDRQPDIVTLIYTFEISGVVRENSHTIVLRRSN